MIFNLIDSLSKKQLLNKDNKIPFILYKKIIKIIIADKLIKSTWKKYIFIKNFKLKFDFIYKQPEEYIINGTTFFLNKPDANEVYISFKKGIKYEFPKPYIKDEIWVRLN